MENTDRLGVPSRFVCPECHGALWEITDGGMLRYRCHVGHAYTGEALMAAQAEQIEETLWSLFRAHQERAAIIRRLIEQDPSSEAAAVLRLRAVEAERDAALVSSLLHEPSSTATAEGPGDDAV